MDRMLEGVLLGAVAIGAIVSLGALLYILNNIAKKVNAAVLALNRAALVFEKSANMSGALTGLTAINRRLVPAVESMTAAMKVFTGMVFQQPGEDDPPAAGLGDYDIPRRPMGRPPIPPFMNEYATVDEAGAMSQSDEELAEIEFQREAEARGEPTVADILGRQTQDEIREEV